MRRLLSLGISKNTPLDIAIAMHAANMVAFSMVVIAVSGAAAFLFDAGRPSFALTGLTLALLYSGSLLLAAAGRFNPARWLFVAAASVHYGMFNLAFGTAGGAQFWIVGLLAYPVIAFARVERRQVMVAQVLIVLVFLVTEAVMRIYGPQIVERTSDAYYFTLVAVAGVVAFGLDYYKNSSVAARGDLEVANHQIAELLDNMLPPSIASRLQHGERVIADSHGEASVLFADLTGFSVLTRRLSPTHLVEVLNRIFSRCDEAAARHGIEKIKTIGDCYMAATGVVSDRVDLPGIDAMAEFALELLCIVESVAGELGLPLGMRIGISTGAVVSGVIGTRGFNFDVWGDTVNLAHQMEQTGIVGRVQVSEATYWRLHQAYRLEPRGEIEVKSGQRVPTYVLTGRAPAVATEAPLH